jgi:tetratricopeptide (TPR) repeat protein
VRAARAIPALLALALLASSCAYYNTFYLARKNYFKGTDGAPYLVDKTPANQAQYFTKAVDYSKKLMSSYPRSKWVDDSYLMWAKSLLAQNDPLQTVNMLQSFTTRYPDSPLRNEATFYLGVGLRQARRNGEALAAFDAFLQAAPRHPLVPYAHMERARVLMALDRPGDAAAAAGTLLERFPKSALAVEARKSRADAYYKRGDFAKAREDFRFLGDRALTEEERLGWLLREADCLEGARDYDASIALLRGALAHEREPQPPPPVTTPPATGTPGATIAPPAPAWNPLATPGADRWGRLQLRVGTAHLLAGRVEPALQSYREVLADYPRTVLGAEAQYRIGYTYETAADDFDAARAEYGKVKMQTAAGGFSEQATQRLATLDRLSQFRGTGGDSTERRAEAGLAKAEIYLFQLDKPDRALQEYQRLAVELKGTPYEAKALNAQAWVLSRKLGRRAEADSLFWQVVRHHPATEAQLAARDYLEATGADVPVALIRMPERKLPVRPDTTRLTPPPAAPPLGGAPGPDSARAGAGLRGSLFGTQRPGPMSPRPDSLGRPHGVPSPFGPGGPLDSLGRAMRPRGPGGPLDSLGRAMSPRGPGIPVSPADSARADSLARGHGAPPSGLPGVGVPAGPRPDSTRVSAAPSPKRGRAAAAALRDSLARAATAKPAAKPAPVAKPAVPDSAATATAAAADSTAPADSTGKKP